MPQPGLDDPIESLLDTQLAATCSAHEIRSILSSNARDYTVFGCFDVTRPATG